MGVLAGKQVRLDKAGEPDKPRSEQYDNDGCYHQSQDAFHRMRLGARAGRTFRIICPSLCSSARLLLLAHVDSACHTSKIISFRLDAGFAPIRSMICLILRRSMCRHLAGAASGSEYLILLIRAHAHPLRSVVPDQGGVASSLKADDLLRPGSLVAHIAGEAMHDLAGVREPGERACGCARRPRS